MPHRSAILAAALAAAWAGAAAAATPEDIAATYAKAAGAVPSLDRGRQFFTSPHGREWSCATCHGAAPTREGRHAATGKPIAPLAPAFQPGRLGDPAKVEKWLRRNCNDVAGRDCTPLEKADITAWLTSLKP